MKVIKHKDIENIKIIKNGIMIHENHRDIIITFFKNGSLNNNKTCSYIVVNKSIHNTKVSKFYYYSNCIYYDIKNDASWKEKVKEVKRENKLKIFK